MRVKHTQGKVIPAVSSFPPIGSCYAVSVQDTKVAIAITGKFDEPNADISEANARRIAACWNACDGIPTAWLEGGAADILEHSIALIKQRDELLTALQLILSADYRGYGIDYIKGCANAAIAKAESNITT